MESSSQYASKFFANDRRLLEKKREKLGSGASESTTVRIAKWINRIEICYFQDYHVSYSMARVIKK
jgi:hypothetical protein